MKLVDATEDNLAVDDSVILKSVADPARSDIDYIVACNSKRVTCFKRADTVLADHRRRYHGGDTKEGDLLVGVFMSGGTNYLRPDKLWKVIY
jgi:hypothetical protein